MERVENVYTSYAGFYDVLFDRLLDPGRQAAVEELQIGTGDRVLEVGIGTGLSLRYFPSCAFLTGIDISAAMLAEAEQRVERLRLANVRLLRMDARRLDFPDDEFDRILLPYVLSTVPEPETVIDELVRVSRPGARIGILNHFGSRIRWIHLFERVLSPLTERLGFRLDLPVATVAGRGDLAVAKRRRVNPMRLWQLLVCENRKGPA